MTNKVFPLILIALGAAFLAVASQLSLPIGALPLTLQTLAVGLIATLYRTRETFLTILLYLLLGLINLPVFHNGLSGLPVVTGPTGGFLLAFIIAGPTITGLVRIFGRTHLSLFFSSLSGLFLTLLIGTVWLKFYFSLDWGKAFLTGFAPFVIGEVLKAVLITFISFSLYKILSRSTRYFNRNI